MTPPDPQKKTEDERRRILIERVGMLKSAQVCPYVPGLPTGPGVAKLVPVTADQVAAAHGVLHRSPDIPGARAVVKVPSEEVGAKPTDLVAVQFVTMFRPEDLVYDWVCESPMTACTTRKLQNFVVSLKIEPDEFFEHIPAGILPNDLDYVKLRVSARDPDHAAYRARVHVASSINSATVCHIIAVAPELEEQN